MCPELKNLRHIKVDIDVSDGSLVYIWNEMARALKESGCPSAQMITLRQQYFIGAQTSLKILSNALEKKDVNVLDRMADEIKNNLMDGI